VAVAVHLTTKMSHDEYEQVMRDLQGPGGQAPEGRRYHAAYGEDGDLHVFEVWDSEDDFRRSFDNVWLGAVGLGAITGLHAVHRELPD
jgi:hypothetical protein